MKWVLLTSGGPPGYLVLRLVMKRYTQLPHDTETGTNLGWCHLSSSSPLFSFRHEVYQVFDYKLSIACAKIRLIIIIKNA